MADVRVVIRRHFPVGPDRRIVEKVACQDPTCLKKTEAVEAVAGEKRKLKSALNLTLRRFPLGQDGRRRWAQETRKTDPTIRSVFLLTVYVIQFVV